MKHAKATLTMAALMFIHPGPAQASFVDDLMNWIDPPSRWEQSPDGVFPLYGDNTSISDAFWSVYEGGQQNRESYGEQNQTPSHSANTPHVCCGE